MLNWLMKNLKKSYEKLFNACPRPSEYKTEEYMSVRKKFENQEKIISIQELPGEKWVKHPTLKTYEVSNLGRAKI